LQLARRKLFLRQSTVLHP